MAIEAIRQKNLSAKNARHDQRYYDPKPSITLTRLRNAYNFGLVELWLEDILACGNGERRRVPRDLIGIGVRDYEH